MLDSSIFKRAFLLTLLHLNLLKIHPKSITAVANRPFNTPFIPACACSPQTTLSLLACKADGRLGPLDGRFRRWFCSDVHLAENDEDHSKENRSSSHGLVPSFDFTCSVPRFETSAPCINVSRAFEFLGVVGWVRTRPLLLFGDHVSAYIDNRPARGRK